MGRALVFVGTFFALLIPVMVKLLTVQHQQDKRTALGGNK